MEKLLQKGIELYNEAIFTHDFTEYTKWIKVLEEVTGVYHDDITKMILKLIK